MIITYLIKQINFKKIFTFSFSPIFLLIGCDDYNINPTEQPNKHKYNGEVDYIIEEKYSPDGHTNIQLNEFDKNEQKKSREITYIYNNYIHRIKDYYSSLGDLDSSISIDETYDGEIEESKSYWSKTNGDSSISFNYFKNKPKEITKKRISITKYDEKGNYILEVLSEQGLETDVIKHENLYDSLGNWIQTTRYDNDKLDEIIKYKIIYKGQNNKIRENILQEYHSKVKGLKNN
jgi:hypothetical protein